jgi:ABC-2 type transporter
MEVKKYIDQFLAFTQKEFFHILRDRKTLLVLLVLPLTQLLIFGFALSSELLDTPTVVLDLSNDEATRRIASGIESVSTFKMLGHVKNKEEMEKLFRKGTLKVAIVFKPGFGEELKRTGKTDLQLIVDASLKHDASTIEGHIQSVLLKYQQELNKSSELPIQINPVIQMRYNPQLKSAFHFVPGVIGIVLMLVCSMMASLAIVKEKESGTMEVLLVSPVRPSVIILSKLVPYLLIGMIDVIIILLVSIFVLGVPVSGNIFLLFGMASIFTLSSLALGIMVSVLTSTQRSAIIISIVGLMLPSITMSGFIFPIDPNATTIYIVSHMMPVTAFITAARSIMIKGMGFAAVYPELVLLTIMTIVLITISIKSFKNRLS